MRVNPFYISNLAGSLNQTQASEQQLTAQLSSGVRVNSLSDDPLAAGQNVLLLNQIQRDDSFTQTSSLVQGQLQVADSALGGVVSQLTQAISLATGANNGTLNANDLKAISSQIAGIRDEVVALANTSYQGQYIFGGSQTGNRSVQHLRRDDSGHRCLQRRCNRELSGDAQRAAHSVECSGRPDFHGRRARTDVLGVLNQLVADFATGAAAATSVADTTALNTALNFVSQQRVVLDNSLTRLTAATDAANTEKMQLTAAQTNLMQADVANIATQLSLRRHNRLRSKT